MAPALTSRGTGDENDLAFHASCHEVTPLSVQISGVGSPSRHGRLGVTWWCSRRRP
ncbi:hypothetical protein ACFFX0_02780 [Citricoccus parietis]|uniref:Uncharacterized protein n=1 Tax=Citricoccus parietis TaxID=592307 RepID=A0ABV5FU18_9MICC